MKSDSTFRPAGAPLRAVCVAAALACGASAAMAAGSMVTITSFSVSAAEFSGNFAWVTDAYQSLSMSALEAGGLAGTSSDSFNADNWNLGLNRLAQTANATATGNTVQFTDAATQLTTAGYSLSALANPGVYSPTALPNSGYASAVQSGAFVLLDGDGAPAGGTITFDLYYDMNVASTSGGPTSFAQTTLNLLSSTDTGGSASFDDGLLSGALVGGAGATSGHFSWTYTLAAGEAAYYTLSSGAFASAVAAVPEPSSCALMALGLAGIGTLTYRRRSSAA